MRVNVDSKTIALPPSPSRCRLSCEHQVHERNPNAHEREGFYREIFLGLWHHGEHLSEPARIFVFPQCSLYY
jgi:hypothetical protein